MIPEYKLSIYSERSVYKKIAEWLPIDNHNEEDITDECAQEFAHREQMQFDENEVLFVSPRFAKDTFRNTLDLKIETEKFYKIIIETIDGNLLDLDRRHFPDDEKRKIINALSDNGFNVCDDDFWDIILVAKGFRDGTTKAKRIINDIDEQFRHASLNCHDYDILKTEFNNLAKVVGFNSLKIHCHTLYHIVRQAMDGSMDSYPGRHLPFDKIKGRTAQRYQCLRIMDEILCTSDHPIKNDEMMSLISNKAKEYNRTVRNGSKSLQALSENSISESALKKLYVILKEMINTDHRTRKVKYDKSVYEDGRNGHLYKMYKNGCRLSAFTVDISIDEAFLLRREIGCIRAKYFNDDREFFAQSYPLISMIGYIQEVATDSTLREKYLNSISGTDMTVINYKHPEYRELKQKVSQAMSLNIPISVINEKGNWETIIPKSIKEDGDKWVLIAQMVDSPEIRIIPAETLNRTFNITDNISKEVFPKCNPVLPENIIGIGRLYKNVPYNISLVLTEKGVDDVTGKDSVFIPMNPTVDRSHSLYDYRHTEKISNYVISFKIYINEDFLSELFRLDKTAKLITVEPDDVRDLYEEYYERRMGSPRVPLDQRTSRTKYLKEPKREISE